MIRGVGEQGNQQVFKCNNADAQLHQFGIGEWNVLRLSMLQIPPSLRAARSGPALIVPPRQRHAPVL